MKFGMWITFKTKLNEKPTVLGLKKAKNLVFYIYLKETTLYRVSGVVKET